MDSRGGTGHSRQDVVGFGTDGELFEEAVAGCSSCWGGCVGIVGGDGCESRRWARACLAGLRCRAMVDDDDSVII